MPPVTPPPSESPEVSWRDRQVGAIGVAVRHLLTRPLVTCATETTIRDAARLMADADAPSAVVLEERSRPIAIITDSDLRQVLAAGRDPGAAVDTIASRPLVTVDADAFAFEAAQAMLANRLHHLVVLDGDQTIGVIADGDLMAAQAGGPLFVARQIDRAQTIDRLVDLGPARVQAVSLLTHAGLSGEAIGRLTAETNDHLARRILALLEAELGPPPVKYCWLGLGSEGRREQGLRTDQDNALVYADPPDDLAGMAASYFETLAERAVAAIERCGFPRCAGGMMASNPAWRLPLAGWRHRFLAWVRRPEPDALLGAEIFFDLRGLAGDPGLAAQLWDDLLDWIADAPLFRQLLLGAALDHRPAIGLFGRFALERHGEHRGSFHVKHRGVMPVVELARAYALAVGIRETNTFERLRLLAAHGAIPHSDADDVLAAYERLSQLRFAQHVEQVEAGRELHDYVDPGRLPRVERQALREHLRVIGEIQAYVRGQVAVGGHG